MKSIFFTSLILLIFSHVSFSKIIVVDPGHNFDDIASGYRTATEVNTNWAVANKLKNIIEKDPLLTWTVILTRENNLAGVKVSILDRYERANQWENKRPGEVYFLSIHCNGGGGNAKGTETFYCNHTFKSNNTLLKRYAQNIHNHIVEYGDMNDRRCVEDASYFSSSLHCNGHLCVLEQLEMPNCLNEIGFADNFEDEIKLLDDKYRNKFALAYFDAFKATFSPIEVVSYNFENLPCFSKNENFVKLNVTLKNVSNKNFYGDIKATLKHFPYNKLDALTSDFSGLGKDQYIYLSPTQQKVLTFENNVPFTMEVGMALMIESKSSTSDQWSKVPTPNHKKIIKVPMNGAKIEGVVYSSDYNPLQGAEVWSYQAPTTKSSFLYSDIFDPTRTSSDKNGKYDLLIPADWNEAVVSISNHQFYDETLVSPVVNSKLSHYYNSKPKIIGVGSGSGNCGGIKGQTPDDANQINGSLNNFENISFNDQSGIASVKPGEKLTLGVSPTPVNYSQTRLYACGGSVKDILVYFSIVDCYVPHNYQYNKNGNSFFYIDYRLRITEIDDNNKPIGTMTEKSFKETVDRDFTLLRHIDINKCLSEMNFRLLDGKRYLMKFSYTHKNSANSKEWSFLYPDNGYMTDKSIVLNVNLNSIKLDDSNISGKKYIYENIEVSNANIKISNELELIASNKIRILPDTRIKGKFRAHIGSIKKSSEIVESPRNEVDFEPLLIFDNDHDIFNKRFISTISNHCPCEIKVQALNESDIDQIDIQVFPNPTKDKLLIKTNTAIKGEYRIHDLTGKILRQGSILGYTEIIDVDDLSAGKYIINVKTGEKNYSSKFVKIQ